MRDSIGHSNERHSLALSGAEREVLALEVIRGPLSGERDYEVIRQEHARLTDSESSETKWRHWLLDGSEGPALHAILRTEKGEIAGHACVIPLPIRIGARRVIGGKVEYYFLKERYRRERVEGTGRQHRSPALIMLRELVGHAHEQLDWDPILGSTLPRVSRLVRRVGFHAMELPVVECLLILKPWNAFRYTRNLSLGPRLLLFLGGMPQSLLWQILRRLLTRHGEILTPTGWDDVGDGPGTALVGFADEPTYLKWRFPHQCYRRYAFKVRADGYVLAQKGSKNSYLRICHARVGTSDVAITPMVVELIRDACSQGAIGVRWAIYRHSSVPVGYVKRLRRLGFLCVRRRRELVIHTRQPQLAEPQRWHFDDNLVSFIQ